MLLRVLSLTVFAVIAYLLLMPIEIVPVSWEAPAAPDYENPFAVNTSLADFDSLDLAGQTGPEGVTVDSKGFVYATTEQGWIVRWLPNSKTGELWAQTGGRPLGITPGKNGGLWVADAFLGVLHVSSNGKVTNFLTEVNDTPLLYANDLVIVADRLYVSDSTARFSPKRYNSTYKASLLDIMEHGRTGRVIEYDLVTAKSRVIMEGLSFANGVTADVDGRFLLVNETAEYRVWKYWLRGERKGQTEVILSNLPGFPDNITAGRQGRYWLGFTSPRIAVLDKLADKPFLRTVVQRLPTFIRPQTKYYGHILAISAEGEVLQNLQDPAAHYPLTTGAMETQDYLYVSSLIAPNLARFDKTRLFAHTQ